MTLRHVVAWRLAATDAAVKHEQAQAIVDALRALDGVVPEIESISVGVNAVHGGANWDVALVVDVADEAALDAYQTHPAHEELVGFVRSVVSERVAVDFEL